MSDNVFGWSILAVVCVAAIVILIGYLSENYAPLYTRFPQKTGIALVDRPVDYIAPWALQVGTRYPGNVD